MRFLLPPSIALVAAFAAVLLAHCGGGSTTSFPVTDAAADVTTAGADDAGDGAPACTFGCAADASVPFVLCPASPPQAGAPCAVPGESCEYGTSFWLECNQVLQCLNGVWRQEYAGVSCTWLDAGGPCPATWQQANALDASASCPIADCQYLEGYCECGAACGSGGQRHGRNVFVQPRCAAAASGCPSPRPRLGTACTGHEDCTYGWPCGCGQMQQCVDGVWQGAPTPACP
jgi:hypothetical protein